MLRLALHPTASIQRRHFDVRVKLHLKRRLLGVPWWLFLVAGCVVYFACSPAIRPQTPLTAARYLGSTNFIRSPGGELIPGDWISGQARGITVDIGEQTTARDEWWVGVGGLAPTATEHEILTKQHPLGFMRLITVFDFTAFADEPDAPSKQRIAIGAEIRSKRPTASQPTGFPPFRWLEPDAAGFRYNIRLGASWLGLAIAATGALRAIHPSARERGVARASLGLCPGCAYPMTGVEGTCPECGTPTPA